MFRNCDNVLNVHIVVIHVNLVNVLILANEDNLLIRKNARSLFNVGIDKSFKMVYDYPYHEQRRGSIMFKVGSGLAEKKPANNSPEAVASAVPDAKPPIDSTPAPDATVSSDNSIHSDTTPDNPVGKKRGPYKKRGDKSSPATKGNMRTIILKVTDETFALLKRHSMKKSLKENADITVPGLMYAHINSITEKERNND